MREQTLSDPEIQEIAVAAYLYFYPLITMELTRRVTTNLEAGQKPGYGPMNQFHHVRAYPDAAFQAVVRPNFDTLYSLAWLDLTKEPVIVSAPNTHGRYYLLPGLDMWTDVLAVPGKRTSGTRAGSWAFVPPGWRGELPRGVDFIQASTRYVWIIGRTQTNGPKDYAAVHRVQDGYTLVPLSRWGLGPQRVAFQSDPSVDMLTPPLMQVSTMPVEKYFSLGAALMAVHPPHVTDWSLLAQLGRIGIEPGRRFTLAAAPSLVKKALARAMVDGQALLRAKFPTMGRSVNGWLMNTETMGVYGNAYLKRALVARVGLGANQPEDAIYPINLADADGQPLDGAYNYVLHCAKSELPPAGAFWSLTLYDSDGFAVANPINRFALGDRDKLRHNPDGSLDIYIQYRSPGAAKGSNWLPAPVGPFNLTMRLYAPKPQALDGSWVPPVVQRR